VAPAAPPGHRDGHRGRHQDQHGQQEARVRDGHRGAQRLGDPAGRQQHGHGATGERQPPQLQPGALAAASVPGDQAADRAAETGQQQREAGQQRHQRRRRGRRGRTPDGLAAGDRQRAGRSGRGWSPS
jgi:hypothetical protein